MYLGSNTMYLSGIPVCINISDLPTYMCSQITMTTIPHTTCMHVLILNFYLFLGHKRMWTSTNYFLVNLSITDLLLTVLNGLFNFIYMRDNNWIFGDIYCTINNFVAYVTVAASVLTLTAITLDR